jgi:hypothetical protein
MGIEETKDAIKAAGEAFVTWGKTTAKVTSPLFWTLLFANLWLVQHRHDILMKFYSLMKEHENDLARIIVSPNTNTFILETRLHSRSQTLENGKALAEAKVGTNGCSEITLHAMAIIRAKIHTVPLSLR